MTLDTDMLLQKIYKINQDDTDILLQKYTKKKNKDDTDMLLQVAGFGF